MRLLSAFLLLQFAVGVAAFAQTQKDDPLSPGEADDIRELGARPVDRIKLLLKLTEKRMDAIRELTPDSTENSRPAELSLSFRQFAYLADELGENIDTYDKDQADIRKALRAVMAGSSGWAEALRAPAPDERYDIERRTALDAAEDTVKDAQEVFERENAYFAAHKKEANGNGRAPSPE